MTTYRTKPVTVEAVQWHGTDGKSLLRDFTGQDVEYGYDHHGAWALIPTFYGTVTARSGDWVTKDMHEQCNVQDGITFTARYEKVEEPR